jgi:2-octaprenyl-6-methoxyphenol hydroxylase
VTLDIAVIGAGPVGATVAALCAQASLDIAVFEARNAPARDPRILALSHASRCILEDAGAWPSSDATAIAEIHVSQKGAPGRTLIGAAEHGIPALGYTVAYARLQEALEARLDALGVSVRYAHACNEIHLDENIARIGFESGEPVEARLLVLADGGANATRIPGIAFAEKDYRQSAVVAALRTDRAHGARAYERFTPMGPVALLPVDDRYALVWTARPREAARLVALDDRVFLEELQEHFGDRAGRFVSIEARKSFPLALRVVNAPIALRTAIVGNAAQALHPIAGQGLNLGLRDAAVLSDAARAVPREELGSRVMLNGFRAARRRDRSAGVAFTDFLVSAFAEGSLVPPWGRALGLLALDVLPPARRIFARRMIHGAPVA